MEYLVETPGEAIPHLNMRIFYKHRGIADRFDRHDRPPTACCSPSGPRASPPSRTRSPTATRSRRSPACEIPRRPPWSGSCTPSWSGSPTTSTSPCGWPTRPAWRSPPPASHCTRSGCCGWSAACAAAVSAAASWSPAACRRSRGRRPAELLAELGRLEKRVTRGRADADGHLLVPRPAARHRPAAPGPGPGARRPRPDRARRPGYSDDARIARPYDAYPLLGAEPAGAH